VGGQEMHQKPGVNVMSYNKSILDTVHQFQFTAH